MVIAIVKSTGYSQALLTIGLTLLFIAVMLLLIKPRVESLIEKRIQASTRSQLTLSGIVAFALASHGLPKRLAFTRSFGGFLAGVVMPFNHRSTDLSQGTNRGFQRGGTHCHSSLFSPGLRTQITLTERPE